MLRDVALVGLGLFAACAGSAPPTENTVPPRRAADSPVLAGARQPEPREQEPQHQEPPSKTQQPVAPTPPLPRPVPPPDSREQLLHPIEHPADPLQMVSIDAGSRMQRPAGLAAFATAEEMRAHLEAGFTRQELQFVGFDRVTIAECVDHVVAASFEVRRQPHDPKVRSQFSEWNALYLAARREAEVRRTAGAAICLPPVR